MVRRMQTSMLQESCQLCGGSQAQVAMICSTCQLDLPETAFYHLPNGKRHGRRCLQCRATYQKEWYIANRDRTLQRQHERRNANPDLTLAKDRIYRQSPHGKHIQRESSRRWRQTANGQQKMREAKGRYRLSKNGQEQIRVYGQSSAGKASRVRITHNRRMGQKGTATLTNAEWQAICKQYKNQCVYCGQAKKLERDHIIPSAKGGKLVKANIVPACRSCNAKKGAKITLLTMLAT